MEENNESNLHNLSKILEKGNELCFKCTNNFSFCIYCKGYFVSLTFNDEHLSSCRYKISSKDNLVECKECKGYLKEHDLEFHRKKCETKICLFCSFPFPLGIIKDHQFKCQIDQNDLILIREKENCIYCKEPVSLSLLESHEKTCKVLKQKTDSIEKTLNEMEIEYPKEWDPLKTDNTVELFILPLNCGEFQFAESLFRRSVTNVKFTKMWRIQNKNLWGKYYREKIKIIKEKGSCEEQFLFHGTRSNSPRILYTTGFDVSFSSDGGMYGRGIYFARQSVYSFSGYAFNYDKKNYMFLALVLTGKTKVMNSDSSLRKPPFLDRSKYIYYDSVTDVSNPTNSYDISQMFIVYNNEKAYPYYLMEYEHI